MDLRDSRHEGLRGLGPIDARDDERSEGPHLSGSEFAVLPANLEDSFVVSSALLLARIAQRRLDPDTEVEILDRCKVPKPTDRLHGHREIVRVFLPRDLRAPDPFVRRGGRERLAEGLGEGELAAPLGPSRAAPEGTTRLAA